MEKVIQQPETSAGVYLSEEDDDPAAQRNDKDYMVLYSPGRKKDDNTEKGGRCNIHGGGPEIVENRVRGW